MNKPMQISLNERNLAFLLLYKVTFRKNPPEYHSNAYVSTIQVKFHFTNRWFENEMDRKETSGATNTPIVQYALIRGIRETCSSTDNEKYLRIGEMWVNALHIALAPRIPVRL